MTRREFITLLGGTAVAWPLAARAQQTGRMQRIGIIDPAVMWDHFRQGLRDLGYVEGRNIAIKKKIEPSLVFRLASIPKARRNVLGTRGLSRSDFVTFFALARYTSTYDFTADTPRVRC